MFSAGKIMMSRTVIFGYVFVIPILRSKPKGKGLNVVPLNPTYMPMFITLGSILWKPKPVYRFQSATSQRTAL